MEKCAYADATETGIQCGKAQIQANIAAVWEEAHGINRVIPAPYQRPAWFELMTEEKAKNEAYPHNTMQAGVRPLYYGLMKHDEAWPEASNDNRIVHAGSKRTRHYDLLPHDVAWDEAYRHVSHDQAWDRALAEMN